MAERQAIAALSDLANGQEADMFLLLVRKEETSTRDGKVYWKVAFRDSRRVVAFPIWSNSPHAKACREQWQVGTFYKVRAKYRETNFGAELDIRKIREATDDDHSDGFDPLAFLRCSRHEPEAMLRELYAIVQEHIHDVPLRELVNGIITENAQTIRDLPAATHHHDFRSGFLEHQLSVAQNAVFLANKYHKTHPEHLDSLGRDLVVAGAILHDIGKLRELKATPEGAAFTLEGELIGHILLGRDIVRDAAHRYPLGNESLLRLEHIIAAHQRTPEWGSPKPPMTLEALLVFYADDIDARTQMMVEAIEGDVGNGPLTSRKNLLGQKVVKHWPAADPARSEETSACKDTEC